MQTERKAIIIREIQYWKSHRMLPEKQCDYLLALYTEGESLSEGPDTERASSSVFILIHCVLLALMIPLSFLLLYFTEFGESLQLGFLSLFLFYAIFITAYFIREGYRASYFPFLVTLLLLLVAVSHVLTLLTQNRMIIIAGIMICFVIWFFAGKRMEMKYVTAGSAIGMVFAAVYAILQ